MAAPFFPVKSDSTGLVAEPSNFVIGAANIPTTITPQIAGLIISRAASAAAVGVAMSNTTAANGWSWQIPGSGMSNPGTMELYDATNSVSRFRVGLTGQPTFPYFNAAGVIVTDASGNLTQVNKGANSTFFGLDGSGNFVFASQSVISSANPTASIGLSVVNGAAATFMRSDGAPALSQAIVPTWTGIHTFSHAGIGAVSTDGIILMNTTAATVGSQQYSPRTHYTGQGWKTNATAGSQTVDFIEELRPVQGTANPTSILAWASQINGGGYGDKLTLTSAGALTATGPISGSNLSLGGALTTAGAITLSGAGTSITLSGNPTLNDWFDQSVKTTASPSFVSLTSTSASNFASGTTITSTAAQFPSGLTVSESFHATSRRASIAVGSWIILQDVNGTGNKDFNIYDSSAGSDRFSISTAGAVNIGSGINNNGGGFKHSRVTTGSISGSATALVTVTWSTAFADSSYTVNATVQDSTTSSSSLSVVHIESVTASAVTVRVSNTSGGALTGTVHVVAIHD